MRRSACIHCIGIALLSLLFNLSANAVETLRLIAAPTAPYVYVEQGFAIGPGVDYARQLAEGLGMHAQINIAPNYGRAFLEVSSGNADVLVFCTTSPDRDRTATFFPTGTTTTVSWFYKPEAEFDPGNADSKSRAMIGVYLNSSHQQWLLDNGFQHVIGNTSYEALAKMLDAGRLPAVYTLELPFESAMSQLHIPLSRFKKHAQMTLHFGFYFSNTWLAAHPGMVQKIKSEIARLDTVTKR